MAKVADTGIAKSGSLMVSGRHKTLPNGRTTIICEVDGHVTKYSFNDASNHEAEYMATLRALRHAMRCPSTYFTTDSNVHALPKLRFLEILAIVARALRNF